MSDRTSLQGAAAQKGKGVFWTGGQQGESYQGTPYADVLRGMGGNDTLAGGL